jgi:hypothetical protein
VIDEWPMNVSSAFGLTPAAIIRLANVWRHSCSVIGLSFAASCLVLRRQPRVSAQTYMYDQIRLSRWPLLPPHVSLAAERVTGLFGPSGSGKSTLTGCGISASETCLIPMSRCPERGMLGSLRIIGEYQSERRVEALDAQGSWCVHGNHPFRTSRAGG